MKEEDSTMMDEIRDFNIYRRGGRYYVTVAMSGHDVDWVSIPDVVPVEPTVESIAAAFRRLDPLIREAFAEAPRGASYEYSNDRRWERMGAKNPAQFKRSTSYCNVDLRSDRIAIWYMLPDTLTNLFASIDEEPNAKLPPDASCEDIARAVLDIFARYPPPPGDKQPASKRPATRP